MPFNVLNVGFLPSALQTASIAADYIIEFVVAQDFVCVFVLCHWYRLLSEHYTPEPEKFFLSRHDFYLPDCDLMYDQTSSWFNSLPSTKYLLARLPKS